MARSHPETWLITENNVRETNAGEEGLRETKNNVLGLATEDGGRQYQLWKTVSSGHIKIESMKPATLQRETNMTQLVSNTQDSVYLTDVSAQQLTDTKYRRLRTSWTDNL